MESGSFLEQESLFFCIFFKFWSGALGRLSSLYPGRENPHDSPPKISNSAFNLNSVPLEGASVFHLHLF